MSGIRAQVIADSVSPAGHRLTTLEVRFPRQILAEVNTHRAFSRNSASSRAVPVDKMLKQVSDDPFIPFRWQRAQPGMQGGDDLSPADARDARQIWLMARDMACVNARTLLKIGVHKTIPNRLLEPFAWHTAIISGTSWDGFWEQRCNDGAEIHMLATADAMRAAYDASTPRPVASEQWHLPYITDQDIRDVYHLSDLRKISAARCARVSYLTHDGRRDHREDLALFEKLAAARPPHWSPMEHVATPMPQGPHYIHRGNFTGWSQLRHFLEG